MKSIKKVWHLVVLFSLAAGISAPAAQAGENWRGGGIGTTRPEGGVHVDSFSGQSTRLGRFTGSGFHVLNPDFTFVGQATWTAANGDTLKVTYSGQVFPSGDPDYPYGFFAELVAVGGTGRLADARGQATMTGAFTGVPGDLFFDVDGALHPRGK